MEKKCKNCGAPIGGFWANLSKLWGVKRSTTHPEYCNTCAPKDNEKTVNRATPAAATPPASSPRDSETPTATHDCLGEGCPDPSHQNEPNGGSEPKVEPAQPIATEPPSLMDHDCAGPTCTHPSHKREE